MYDIYAIGNALVDTEIETVDSELQELDIQKGVMTLVEAERIVELLSHFGHRIQNQTCGGSAANTIITATGFGSKCYYSCKVADDETGHLFLEDLAKNNVDTNLTVKELEEGYSGVCAVFITPDAERTLNTFLGATSEFSTKELDPTAIEKSKYLYIEGYLVPTPNGVEAAIQARNIAKEAGVKVAITLSDPNMVTYFKDPLHSIIDGHIDLLFCNEEEAKLFTGKDTLEEAKKELNKIADLSAITLGKDGALITGNQTELHIPGVPTKAIDTNGAGDCFAGAFLSYLIQGKSLEECGKIANKAASQVVSQFGPRLKTPLTL